MKLAITCQICGRTISSVEKYQITQDDINNYSNNSSCQVDGPFQTFDDDGNPLPLDYSNIVATKTLT
jgi:hypothetical protein